MVGLTMFLCRMWPPGRWGVGSARTSLALNTFLALSQDIYGRDKIDDE